MHDLISLSKSRFYIKYFFVFTGEINISTNENGKAVFARDVVSTHLKVLHIYRNKRSFTPEGCSMMSLPVITWSPLRMESPSGWNPLMTEPPQDRTPSGWNSPQDRTPLMTEPPHDRTPS